MRIDRLAAASRAALAPFCLALALLAPAHAAAQAADNVALVHKLLLEQRMVVTRGAEVQAATLGQRLASGDLVVTNANTRAAIRFTDDGSLIRLNPNSRLQVRREGDRGAATKILELEFGELWARVTEQRTDRSFQVQTPSGVAAVKGTEFVVRVDEQGNTTVLTFDGAVDFFNGAGLVTVEQGRKATAAGNTAMGELEEITDADARALGALTADDAADDVVRVEIPVQNADGVARTLVLELPRAEAERILNGGGGR